MIDLDQRFAHAWADEPLLPDALDRLAAGKTSLRRRRMATTTLGSVAAVVLVVAGSSLVGGGAPRSAEPGYSTTSPQATPSTAPMADLPVRDPQGYSTDPLWADNHQVYRADESVEILRMDDTRPVLDARTGKQLGHELVVESRWLGDTYTQYFDFAGGRFRGGGGNVGSYASLVAQADSPLFYDSGPGYFELFDSPVGVDSDGLTAKTGATIESQRAARAGEFSTRRFDASAPSVGVATIAGFRYYAIAGYTSTGKDVIVAQQAHDRTLGEFLAEVKRGMDEGSIKG